MLDATPVKPFHPGLYLQELLTWRHLTAEEFSAITGMPEMEIIDLTESRRDIDRRFSECLASYFGNTPQFWLELQALFDQRGRDAPGSIRN